VIWESIFYCLDPDGIEGLCSTNGLGVRMDADDRAFLSLCKKVDGELEFVSLLFDGKPVAPIDGGFSWIGPGDVILSDRELHDGSPRATPNPIAGAVVEESTVREAQPGWPKDDIPMDDQTIVMSLTEAAVIYLDNEDREAAARIFTDLIDAKSIQAFRHTRQRWHFNYRQFPRNSWAKIRRQSAT
jgi:hypothetical protein